MNVRSSISALAVLCLLLAGMQTATAGVIGTGELMAGSDRDAQITRIRAVLADEQVEQQLVALGVDPAQAAERVSALNATELARLEAGLDDMPAGGSLLGVIGVVFVVLLILEITGVTDIFKRI